MLYRMKPAYTFRQMAIDLELNDKSNLERGNEQSSKQSR